MYFVDDATTGRGQVRIFHLWKTNYLQSGVMHGVIIDIRKRQNRIYSNFAVMWTLTIIEQLLMHVNVVILI